MKKYYYIVVFASLSSIFFAILMQSFNLINIITGFIIGAVGSIIINKGMIISPSIKKTLVYMLHFFKLIIDILKSTLEVIPKAFLKSNVKKEIQPANEKISAVIQANSITLTPGTITIDKTDKYIYVLKLLAENEANYD